MPEETATAAVAIIKKTAIPQQDEYLILRRASHPSDPWSGHFSFPGGRKENADRDLLSTCLRETREETGLHLSPKQLELCMPIEPAGRNFNSPLWVQPFLFSIDTNPPLTLEPNEIQSYIWLNAGHFKNLQHHRKVEMLPGHLFPAYPIGDYYLWGFTYRLLMSLLAIEKK